MKKTTTEQQQQRFEFLLLINNHIICQRYFDVKGYNEKCKESLEMKEMMDDITGMNNGAYGSTGIIPKFLQEKSSEYLWSYYNPYQEQKEEDILVKNIYDKMDNFQFEVRVDGEPIARSIFNGNHIPPKVRYQVNIKEIIQDIVSEIRYYLTKNSYTKEYGGVSLNVSNKIAKLN